MRPVATGSGQLKEANSLLNFLMHQCHQCVQQRLQKEGVLWTDVPMVALLEKAASTEEFSGLPKCLSHLLMSQHHYHCLFPQPPTKQGPELRCSGIPPSLSSGIRASHLEMVWWERENHSNINPRGPEHGEASPFQPLANQRLLATSLKPEHPAPEGDS